LKNALSQLEKEGKAIRVAQRKHAHAEGCSHGCTYPCYEMMLRKKIAAVKDED